MKQSAKRAALFLVPCTLLMVFSVFFPVLITFGYSLKHMNLTEPLNEEFVGAVNYTQVLTGAEFRSALLNSLAVLAMVIVIGMAVSLAIALVLHQKTRITPLLMAVVIVPWALPPIVNGIMWKFIFFPGPGLVNKLLEAAGLIQSPVNWIVDRRLFLLVVSVVVAWRIVPFSAVVILSNLENIPRTYYEAMVLEGSTPFQTFRYITLPLILPSLGIVLINLTTTAINVFDEVIALSGYQFENQTLLVYNYATTFQFLDFGLGSAISYVIMAISAVFGYFYVRNMTVEKVYKG
ncbi:Inner membrane ABC transporter permease protein ycjO [Aedoeadaptatus ivorii]|uniref:Inner membrane ABC transporter permease protein ycjO n=1 Tax=Aedoeadaptatus ivorii TaxID=54006 RepID=A0A3S4Y649_9FIRM|nr:sugar ABC transporter permease [Peptoniphilus ivorii]VEJ34320.1 Inner membrane ABC transporter permease protein ycjO [Peptoniphilus ivorii]